MTPLFIAKLGLLARPNNIGMQKIVSSLLETYAMILVVFSVQDSLEKI